MQDGTSEMGAIYERDDPEIGPYIQDLKTVVRATYPERLHGGARYRRYRLDR